MGTPKPLKNYTSYKGLPQLAGLCTVQEAKKQDVLGKVVDGIFNYVSEGNRRRAEGAPPVYVAAPYIHKANDARVPPETKFAYLRKVFPDPDGAFTLRTSPVRTRSCK